MAKRRVNVRVDPDLWEATERTASEEGLSATAVLERALGADDGVQHALAVHENGNGRVESGA